jgi:hypothetical protein
MLFDGLHCRVVNEQNSAAWLDSIIERLVGSPELDR